MLLLLAILGSAAGTTQNEDSSQWSWHEQNHIKQTTRKLSSDEANVPDYELEALSNLYYATNGDNWRYLPFQPGNEWNFSAPYPNPCLEEWQGVFCANFTSDTANVVMLELPLHNLHGSIPSSIGNLTKLVSLDLAANIITGSIPDTFGTLTELVFLNVSENKFIGTIPESLGNLVELKLLDLSGLVLTEVVLKKLIKDDPEHLAVGLSGPIPNSLANLQKLKYFSVGFNELTGSPAAVGHMTQLEYCYLYLNRFTGPLPTSFDNLRHLKKLSIGSNAFTGDGFTLLRNNLNVTQYIIGINQFNGTIPNMIGERTGMVNLDLSYNHFYGTLPSSVQNLKHLSLFNIANNSLVGQIPTYLDDMEDMLYLDLSYNLFNSTVPDCLGNLQYLQFFDLGGNALTGTIPDTLGGLQHIFHFSLGHNLLQGPIPDVLGNFHDAYLLDLDDNHLTGTIPASLGRLGKVQFLNLSDNLLQGTIPDSIVNASSLTTLDLSANQLVGTIPKYIGKLQNLQVLYLQSNQLTGSIPKTIANLTQLEALLLQKNDLVGPLTGVFDANTQHNLTIIQISENHLTGDFPDDIFYLSNLQTLVAVVNCFHGSLPACICDATSLVTIALDGLQSAATCQQKIMPLISNAYVTQHRLLGGIPSCLFELPKLYALHLSGNGLSGSLPKDVNISPSLKSLSLSNNILTGSIPKAFQEKTWTMFDLSFNHLSGDLKTSFAAMPSNGSLSLQTNRLSGKIPDTIVNAQDVSILRGNLFSCGVQKGQLPDRDSDKNDYICGSNAFDAPYYMWLSCVFIVLASAFVLWRRWSYFQDHFQITEIANRLRKYYDFPVKFDPAQDDATSTISIGALDRQYRLRNCKFICDMMDTICENTVVCVAYILIILLIAFPIMSTYTGTHAHAYTYVASAAYLSGTATFSVEFALFTLFLILVLVTFRVTLFRYERESSSKERGSETSSVSSTRRVDYFSKASIGSLPVYAAYFTINLIVVVGVNSAFIYITLYESNEVLIVAQIMLSVFKLVWNNVLTFYAAVFFAEKNLKSKTEEQASVSRVFYMQLFVLLMNNIALPCIVVAAISPGCFYNVFITAPACESSYLYQQCSGVILETGCNIYVTTQASVSYNPPYSYSYQCSSSFVKNYAPAFIYMCFTATFLVPAAQYFLSRFHERCAPGSQMRLLLNRINQYPVLEEIMYDANAPTEPEFRWRMYFNANQILLTQLTFFGILMTFGVVFPPLAAALAFTICVMTLFARLKVGHFLYRCAELNQLQYLDKINKECTRVVSLHMLRNSVWMLIMFSSAFYTLFLFDTLGDALGFDDAFWVLIVTPLIPAMLYLAYRAMLVYTTRVGGVYESQSRDVSMEIIMNPMPPLELSLNSLSSVDLADDSPRSSMTNSMGGSISSQKV